MSSSKESTGNPPDAQEQKRSWWWLMIVPVVLLLFVAYQGGWLYLPSLPSLGADASLGLIFLTGLTAGGLSCVAVQGGLLATTIARREQLLLEEQSQATGHATPILLFLGAKLVAYTLLGALLGLFGSWISLSPTMRGWLQIFIGLFMLGMALQMLDVHPIFRYLVIQPPKKIQRFIRQSSKEDDALTPLFLGALTVFIPCGVTQAMQLLALGSGSATQGALIMFAFVLGTSPIFYLLGLATARLSSAWEGTFMQAAAIAIILMALYSMLAGSRLLGYQIGLGNPIEMADSSDSNIQATPIPILDDGAAQMTGIAASNLPPINADGYQDVKIAALNSGYEPTQLQLRAGVPARLTLVTNETYSCSRAFVIPALGVERVLAETGNETIELMPQEVGSIPFTCSMGMYSGVIEVVANDEPPQLANQAPAATKESDSKIEATEMTGIAASNLPPINADGYQEVKIAALNSGYEPTQLQLRAGVPARLTLVTNETYSCSRAFVIPALGVERVLAETGNETIELMPQEIGSIPFTCSMGMYSGVIEVVANDESPQLANQAPVQEASQAPVATVATGQEASQAPVATVATGQEASQEPVEESTQDEARDEANQEPQRIILTGFYEDQMQIFMMSSDGYEKLTDGPAENIHPTISPSGQWVAYTSRNEGALDIQLMSIDSRIVTSLTTHPSRDYQPIFSPDGSQIAFISDRDGEPDIWLMNVDGSEPRQLLNRESQQHLTGWHPDGQSLLFVDHEQNSLAIWKMNLTDGSITQLTDEGSINDGAVFSPDGQRIAFYSNRAGGLNLFTMAADGSDVQQLTNSEQQMIMPTYSPDGKWIIYGSPQWQGILKIPSTGGEASILVADIQGLPAGWAVVTGQ